VYRHPVDRVVVVVGVPLLVLGLAGLADNLGFIEPGAWLPIALAIALSLAGIARAVLRLRARDERIAQGEPAVGAD
jgi:hypothetical protein